MKAENVDLECKKQFERAKGRVTIWFGYRHEWILRVETGMATDNAWGASAAVPHDDIREAKGWMRGKRCMGRPK